MGQSALPLVRMNSLLPLLLLLVSCSLAEQQDGFLAAMQGYQYQDSAVLEEEVLEEEPHYYSELGAQYYNNYEDADMPLQYYMDDQPEQQSFQEEKIDLNSLQGILNAVTSAGEKQRKPEQEAREVVED